MNLLFIPRRIIVFVRLERKDNRQWKQLFKNLFNNAHILTTQLEWLHFGFATMALQSEHVAQTIGAKMAVSLRGFDIAIYPLKHPKCYDILWQEIDKVHTISDDLISIAYKLGMYRSTSFAKITPAIDIGKFRPDVSHAEKMNNDQIKLLTVGRLHWKKGLIDTLEALFLLRQKGVNFNYVIVGSGKEYEPLSFAIHQLKLTDYVTLVGKKSSDDIIKLMNKCDIYLQYSVSEGFCNAVLEAQAIGCLCVVSDAEGLPENVLNEETGWVVPKCQPILLAKKIIEILDLPKKQQQAFRERAIKRTQLKFTIEEQQKAFTRFYELK